MDESKRLCLLEELGSAMVAEEASRHQTSLGCLEASFTMEDGSVEGMSLAEAIFALAGDVYIYEGFDLREAVSATVVVI